MDCNGRVKIWSIKNWEKADLNNDRCTDLLIIVHWYGTGPLVILDLGKDHFKFTRIAGYQLFKPI